MASATGLRELAVYIGSVVGIALSFLFSAPYAPYVVRGWPRFRLYNNPFEYLPTRYYIEVTFLKIF